MHSRHVLALLFLSLLLGGLVGVHAWKPASRGLPVTLEGRGGEPVHARLYLPSDGGGPWPAVVTIYSMYQVETTTSPTAAALADLGVAALNMDLQGRPARSFEEYAEDLRAAVRFLAYRPDIRPDRVGVLGHSMGADLAATVASSEEAVHATIAVGFPVAVPARGQCLVAVGLYDELHPVEEMRGALQQGGRDADELLVLPMANHVLAVYDAALLEQSARLLGSTPGRCGLPFYLVALGSTFLGGIGLAVCLLTALRVLLVNRLRALRFVTGFLASRAVPLLAVSVIVGVAALHRAHPCDWAHPAIFCLLVGLAVADAIPANTRCDRLATTVLWYAGVIFVVVSATYLAGAGVQFWRRLPESLLFFPYAAAAGFAVGVLKTSGSLFHTMSGTTGLHPFLLALMALEVAAPGRLVGTLAAGARRLVHTLQTLDLRPQGRITPGQAALALVLLAGAVLAWRQTLSAGYALDTDQMIRLALLLARMILLPLVLFTVIVRLRRGRRQEPSPSGG